MRIFSFSEKSKNEDKPTRKVVSESVHQQSFNYSEKISADPRMKRYAPPDISASEVRGKIRDHQLKKEQEMAKAVAERAQANASKKAEMESDVQQGKTMEKPSDISLNDPRDPATLGKLKDAVKMGTFNFSPKEREVLQGILNKQD